MRLNIILIICMMLHFDILYAKSFNEDPNKIFKNLRCLICQGQSVADSNSDFAKTIKLVVEDKIKEGKTEKEIYKFLAEKYGDWIVYKPKFNFMNSVLWIFPYLALVLGGVFIFFLFKKRDNR